MFAALTLEPHIGASLDQLVPNATVGSHGHDDPGLDDRRDVAASRELPIAWELTPLSPLDPRL